MEVERKGIGEEESCHILNGVFSFIMKKLRNKIKKKTVLFPFALYKYPVLTRVKHEYFS